MSDRLVLYESWTATFVAVGLYAALAGVGVITGMRIGGPIGALGWIVAAFFGACVLIALATIFKRDGLILTARGFVIATAGQHIEYRWTQVRAFYTFDRSLLGFRRRVVGIDFVPGEAGPFDTSAARWTDRVTALAGSSTRAVRGPVGALPSTYGQQADELASLLERWRRANTATGD